MNLSSDVILPREDDADDDGNVDDDDIIQSVWQKVMIMMRESWSTVDPCWWSDPWWWWSVEWWWKRWWWWCRDRQAQWAYLCLVLLICLMMWTMWYLGGLERCRYRPNDVAHFTDNPHTLSVEGKASHTQYDSDCPESWYCMWVKLDQYLNWKWSLLFEMLSILNFCILLLLGDGWRWGCA